MQNSEQKILIIDDSQVEQLMLASILKKEDFQVIIASSGPEGLEQARKEIPDIIFLDVMMPGESGFQTCEKLKKDRLTSNIPIIFLSGADSIQSQITGLTVGAVDYITKPFDSEEVIARIRIHLQMKRGLTTLNSQRTNNPQPILEIPPVETVPLEEEKLLCQFSVYQRPIQDSGKKFCKVIGLSDQVDGLFFADVSGEGEAAKSASSALKSLIDKNFNALNTSEEILNMVSHIVYPSTGEGIMMGIICARINHRYKKIIGTCAGDQSIMHINSQRGSRIISIISPALGTDADQVYTNFEIGFEPNDRLIFISKSLVETLTNEGLSEQDALERINHQLSIYKQLPLQALLRETALSICSLDDRPSDDLLMLGLEV